MTDQERPVEERNELLNGLLTTARVAVEEPEALQQATTELVRWLERDYKLSANEAAIVAGTSIRYDIAEVVGQRGKRVDYPVLGEPLDHAFLLEHLLAAGGGELFRKVVVALLELL